MRLFGATRRVEEQSDCSAHRELYQMIQQSGIWAVITRAKQSRGPQVPKPTRDQRTNIFVLTACLLISAFSLWLRSGFPAAATSYWIDDVLFIKLAKNLGFGQWLGQYDYTTLAKGMFYPLFIMGSFMLGIPLKITEQAAYLAAAGLTAWLCMRLTRNKWVGVGVFTLLAFNPVLWHHDLARVIREGLYISLSLSVLALFGLALLPDFHQETPSTQTRLVIPVALGVAGGAFWLTREEGLWLVPGLAVLAGAYAIAAWREWRISRDRVRAQRRLSEAVFRGFVAATAFAVVVGAVDAINWSRYGVFMNNELRSEAFQAAYGALVRIRPQRWQRYVIVSQDAREKAYLVSAAARELEPTLDGKGSEGEAWRQNRVEGCNAMHKVFSVRNAPYIKYVDPCPDILSPFFVWALRDAVRMAGHYRSAGDAQAFYLRLARELNQACDDGRLSCLPARSTLFPPFRWHYVGDALARMPDFLSMLVHLGNAEVGTMPSWGPSEVLELFRDMVGPISDYRSLIRGWIAARATLPRISLRDRTGIAHSTRIFTMNAADVQAALLGFQALRFEVQTDCREMKCEILLEGDGLTDHVFPVPNLRQGTIFASAEEKVYLEAVGEYNHFPGSPSASRMRQELQLAIANGLAGAYSVLMPFLTLIALGGLVLAVAGAPFRPFPTELIGLALACAAAVAARITLLVYLDVTSIPSLNQPYLSPASPFMITFVFLGIYLGSIALAPTTRRCWTRLVGQSDEHLHCGSRASSCEK
jgi:hypothetical protein